MYGLERSQKDLTTCIGNAITSIFKIAENLIIIDEYEEKEDINVNTYEQEKEEKIMTQQVLEFPKREESNEQVTLDMSNGVSKKDSKELEPSIELYMNSNVVDDANSVKLNMEELIESENNLITLEDVMSEIRGERVERAILPHPEELSENVAKYMYLPNGIIPKEDVKNVDTHFREEIIPFIIKLEKERGKRFIFKLESYVNSESFRIRTFDFTTREFYPYDHNDCIIIQFSKGEAKIKGTNNSNTIWSR